MRFANRRPIPRIWHSAYMTLRLPFTFVFSTRRRPWKSASSTIRDWTTTTTREQREKMDSRQPHSLASRSVAGHVGRAHARASLRSPHAHPSHPSPAAPWLSKFVGGGKGIAQTMLEAAKKNRRPREDTGPPQGKLDVSSVSENALQTDQRLNKETKSQTNETDMSMCMKHWKG